VPILTFGRLKATVSDFCNSNSSEKLRTEEMMWNFGILFLEISHDAAKSLVTVTQTQRKKEWLANSVLAA